MAFGAFGALVDDPDLDLGVRSLQEHAGSAGGGGGVVDVVHGADHEVLRGWWEAAVSAAVGEIVVCGFARPRGLTGTAIRPSGAGCAGAGCAGAGCAGAGCAGTACTGAARTGAGCAGA